MKLSICQYKDRFVSAIRNSPVEILLSLLFLALELTTYFNSSIGVSYPILLKLPHYYFASFAIVFALNIIFKNRRIFYYISIIIPILIYLYLDCGYNDNIVLLITTISSVFLIFTAYNEKENIEFTKKAISTTLNVIVSAFLATISALLIYSIIMSVNYIFDIDSNVHFIERMLRYGSIYIILPTLFLTLNYKNDNIISIDKFSEVLINYILTPSLFIYGIILYCYFAKVVILWKLPEGVISITAISFLSIGIIVKASRELTQKKILEWFFKYIGYISIPALIMLWVGSSYRVWEYGFTENRIYLMTTVIILTVWNFAQMFNKTNRYQYFAILIIVLFNTAAHLPYTESETQKREQKENKGSFYVTPKREESIDISQYNKVYQVRDHMNDKNSSASYYRLENDTLSIISADSTIIRKISSEEILNLIFKNANSTPKELNNDIVEKIESMPLILKNDSMMIIINSLFLEKEGDSVKIENVYIDQVFVAEKAN